MKQNHKLYFVIIVKIYCAYSMQSINIFQNKIFMFETFDLFIYNYLQDFIEKT